MLSAGSTGGETAARFAACIAAVVILCLAIGCGGNSVPTLEDEGQLTLFSIDGKGFDSKRYRQGEIPKEVEIFHDWPVLGKTEIVDGQQRREVLAALKSAIDQGKNTAKCFWPRHAIRIVSKGKVTDYLICFECAQVHIYQDGGVTVQPVNREQQDVLDRYLKDAGVPLAP